MKRKQSNITPFLYGVVLGATISAFAVLFLIKPAVKSPFDANGDGHINRAEYRAFSSTLFSLVDQNRNGITEHSEFQNFVKKVRPRLADAVTATIRRKKVDLDGDGKVTRNEFFSKEAMDFLFSQLDKNLDGKIKRGETDAPITRFLFPE